jgi:hypothetical protein
MNYAVEMGSDTMLYVPSFVKTGSGIQKLIGGSPRYTIEKRLDGPQSRSGRRVEEKILHLTVTQTPIPQSSSP